MRRIESNLVLKDVFLAAKQKPNYVTDLLFENKGLQ